MVRDLVSRCCFCERENKKVGGWCFIAYLFTLRRSFFPHNTEYKRELIHFGIRKTIKPSQILDEIRGESFTSGEIS